MKKTLLISLLMSTTLLYFGCQKFEFWEHHHGTNEKNPDAQVATGWYKLQLRFLLERNSTLNAAYFSYIGIALYESVQPGSHDGVSLAKRLYEMPEMPKPEKNKSYNWAASANAAMAIVLRQYNTGLTTANLATIDSLENAYNEAIKKVSGNDEFLRSQLFGQQIATAVYNWSLTDNYNPSNAGYIPPVFPGAWQPTLPGYANGVMPYISAARPLIWVGDDSIAPPKPVTYSEDANSDFYKMVKHVFDVSKSLTAEQKNIALFWVDQGNGVAYTPPGHDFSIVTQAIELAGVNLFKAAEAYAKAGITERESTIICFRSKYKYNQIRPITYIREFIDTSWLPFIVTPPHPEYPAAHAFITGSVMQATAEVLGKLKLTDHTYDFRGWTPRSFDGLFKAGEEAGMSRLYGGIHYLESINIGLQLGHHLGEKIGRIPLSD